MPKTITVFKRNEHSQPVFEYQAEILDQSEKGLLLSAIFGLASVIEEEINILKGDWFKEWYPYQKWFNIYQIYVGQTAQVKAWYCNICRPMYFHESVLEFDDLALDLLVYPDGKQSILDRDEFRALRISGHERRMALEGLEELQDLFMQRKIKDLSELL